MVVATTVQGSWAVVSRRRRQAATTIDTSATSLADGSVGSEDTAEAVVIFSREDAACRLLGHSRRHHWYEDSGIEGSWRSLCLKERSRCDEDSLLRIQGTWVLSASCRSYTVISELHLSLYNLRTNIQCKVSVLMFVCCFEREKNKQDNDLTTKLMSKKKMKLKVFFSVD